MKKFIILFCVFFLPLLALADRGDGAQIILQKHSNDGHFEFPAISDMPDAVYYDSDEMEIVIEADGVSSYYYVEIISDSLNQTVIFTQISGYGDTIDVSSLPTGSYTIVITSQYNNEYEGQFYI